MLVTGVPIGPKRVAHVLQLHRDRRLLAVFTCDVSCQHHSKHRQISDNDHVDPQTERRHDDAVTATATDSDRAVRRPTLDRPRARPVRGRARRSANCNLTAAANACGADADHRAAPPPGARGTRVRRPRRVRRLLRRPDDPATSPLATRRHGPLDRLVAVAQPHLDALAATTGESTYLAVSDGRIATYVATAESARAIRHVGWVGQNVDLDGTALGEALAAPGTTRHPDRSRRARHHRHESGRSPTQREARRRRVDRRPRAPLRRRRSRADHERRSPPPSTQLAHELAHQRRGLTS